MDELCDYLDCDLSAAWELLFIGDRNDRSLPARRLLLCGGHYREVGDELTSSGHWLKTAMSVYS